MHGPDHYFVFPPGHFDDEPAELDPEFGDDNAPPDPERDPTAPIPATLLA